MDLIDEPQVGRNTPEFTVGEIAGAVKRLIEAELGWVRVRGEVGRVVHARSGHLYFDLKDERNVLSCMTWKGQIAAIGVMPEEGMEVVAEGRMTASGFQSKFSLNAMHVAVAGEGALMALLEKRKKALAAEGLFDEARKKKLPYLPEVIGVVTSPQGAVIRDILHRLRDRFPRKVLVWPVAVQGAACAPDVAGAIAGFNRLTPGGAIPRPDLLIVARGGGSIEDLWGFNEEAVARAAAASEIPLISAVGHETDTTLIDFVADLRAPTPTAAAERAVPVRLEVLAWVESQGARMIAAADRGVTERRRRLWDLARALPRAESLTETARQRLDHLDTRLPLGLRSVIASKRLGLTQAGGSVRPIVLTRVLADRHRHLQRVSLRLPAELARQTRASRDRLIRLQARLRPDLVVRETMRGGDRLSSLSRRLDAIAAHQIAQWSARLSALDRLRETLSYKATLQRGYAVVHGPDGVVTRKAVAEAADTLEIEFADGRFAPTLSGPPRTPEASVPSAPATKSPARKNRSRKPVTAPPEQGQLF